MRDSSGFRLCAATLSFFILLSLASCRQPVPELTIWLDSMPDSPDPHFAEKEAARLVASSLFEGLVTRDPLTGNVVPGLAASWAVSDDGISIRFHMRPVRWNDGRLITAQNVVESWQRLLDPRRASPLGWIPAELISGGEEALFGKIPLEDIGVEAVDQNTLVVIPTVPFDMFLQALTHPALSVIPTHIEAEAAGFIGSGPFLLDRWSPETGIRLVSNPDYWNARNVALSRVRFLFPGTRGADGFEFRANEADWEKREVPAASGSWRLNPRPAVEMYLFPCSTPPFSDPQIRRAFSLALDRSGLVARTLEGTGFPASGAVPPLPAYPGLSQAAFDPEAARQLLADGGYPEGRGFPVVSLVFNPSPLHRQVAEFLREEWRKHLNIVCQLLETELSEYGSYTALNKDSGPALLRVGIQPQIPDPVYYLQIFTQGGAHNLGEYGNTLFDRLLTDSAQTAGAAERRSMLRQADKLLTQADQGILPLYYYGAWHRFDDSTWSGWTSSMLDEHPLSRLTPAVSQREVFRPWPQTSPPPRDRNRSFAESAR